MSVDKFIPELWAARLLNALDNSHIATNMVNRDYEGMISQQGDTVHINSIGPIKVQEYVKNADIADPEELATTDQLLAIDQSQYFNFQLDDVDAAQVAGEIMDKAMGRAAYSLADTSDKFLLKTMADGADTKNVITESSPISAANIYAKIVELRTKLDKANVPTTGRSLAIPPEAYAMLLLDDRFVKASDGGTANSVLLRGEVGYCAGFKVFMTNNLPESSGTYSMIATVPSATTYAEQIIKTEAYRMEKRFADAIKGLHVYGAKVTEKTAIAVLKASVGG